MGSRGIGTRIALAALASGTIGIVIVVGGVLIVGSQVFTDLMMKAGDSAAHAREMWDHSVPGVAVAAVVVGGGAGVGGVGACAGWLCRACGRAGRAGPPLWAAGAAARRIAEGDYAARVPR